MDVLKGLVGDLLKLMMVDAGFGVKLGWRQGLRHKVRARFDMIFCLIEVLLSVYDTALDALVRRLASFVRRVRIVEVLVRGGTLAKGDVLDSFGLHGSSLHRVLERLRGVNRSGLLELRRRSLVF